MGIKNNFKKYLPISAIVVLTILLMIFFRYNKRDINSLIEKGKNDLLAFYAQNLKPLFATTEISNEDVFNFALYEGLPIDKEKNKILLISNQEPGNNIFEIKQASFDPNTSNYENFISYLGLDSKNKNAADSILEDFKKEIYLSVLTNDKHALAINPKLAELQKAALADLITFSKKVDSAKTKELFHSDNKLLDEKILSQYSYRTKEIPKNDYIFITPDTVFRAFVKLNLKELEKRKYFEWDKKFVQNNLNNINLNVETERKKIRPKKTQVESSISFVELSDSNIVKVVVPISEMAIQIAGISSDSIERKLQMAGETLRKFTEQGEFRQHIRIRKNEKDSNGKNLKNEKPLKFQFNFDPTAISKFATIVRPEGKINWKEYGDSINSLAKEFGKGISDTIQSRLQNKVWEKSRKKPIIKKDTSIIK